MSDIISVCSTREAYSHNWFEGGKKHSFRIVDGKLKHLAGTDSGWYEMSLPSSSHSIYRVAADNNRVFILTTSGELYWCCLSVDWASWVFFMLTAAEFAAPLLSLLWDHRDVPIEGITYDDFSDWTQAYRNWLTSSHVSYKWNKLERGIDGRDILDIAVGNWHQTVVTYYVFKRSDRKIHFIDEEPIMTSWRKVPGQSAFTLNENSLICASQSVIAISSGENLHWVRFDFHNPTDFKLWPLNWTEIPFWHDWEDEDNYPGWHSLKCPGSITGIGLDTGGGVPWPVPKPHPVANALLGGIYDFVVSVSEEIDERRGVDSTVGFLGDNPISPPSEYSFCCIIRDDQGSYFQANGTNANQAEFSIWNSVSENWCSGVIGNKNTKEVHRPYCIWAAKINTQNRVIYGCVTEALLDGFNGCYYCLRDHDSDT